MTELDEALRLSRAIARQKRQLEKNDAYFEGEQPLKFVAPILEQEMGYRVSPVVLNLCLFAVDVYEHRLDVEGFRLGRGAEADDDLWDVWQENEGPFISQQSHRETLALGRTYATVGPGEDEGDAPAITIESAFDAIHEDDPRTKRVRHGVKKWTDPDKTKWMTYHHQDGWVTWRYAEREWVEDDRDDHDFKLCAIVPLMNDPRVLGRNRPGKFDQRLGRSVFHSILSPLDALNKMASDMMVSGEFHALPRRWATGLNEDDFVDEVTGKALNTFSMIAGRMWGTESEKAKFGQFSEADLANFHNTIKLLMQIVAMELGLPSHYLLFQGDNPPSADAIRSAEAQLVKRAERKQQVLSTRWEQVQRLVLLNLGREEDARPKMIETIWRDPSTPTIAQKADAIVKLVQAKDSSGRSVLPVEQARADLGYTTIEQGRMRDWDDAARRSPQLTDAMRALDDASAVGS
ncbi:phage portal protein [Microbacterium sp. QXD-8]|uniref:Phage portal protein n=1 Tax=Microbacterium psychrotolerans TaxID=3068321 RepID=A0ABU0Z0M3_9MICO|nr:phage portal protein [Microbacterium sp. QXD-8]MDQ7877361.1 phage portal protein [Microbacterium sp. QXD-8]